MQTPQKHAPPSAKKSLRQPNPQPDLQKVVQSDNDTYQPAPQEGDQTPARRKKQPRKKSNARKNGVQSDVGEIQEYDASQRQSSYPTKPRNTPAKTIKSDAYAGPTFHQSPAPSALPRPSFFSKSVPTNAPTSNIADTTDGSADFRQEASKALEETRDTTPLDWMFNAARQARGAPNGASPARMLSPASESPVPSPGPLKDEADFPFELEGVEDNRSPYSTPFSQRLAASRTPHSTSEGGQTLTEEERRAKTEALKQALRASGNPNTLGSPFKESSNPFNARNVSQPNFPPRHTSNPTTPIYQNGYPSPEPNQYFNQVPTSPSRNLAMQPNNRPPSSNLRNVYNPGALSPPMSPPHAAPEQRSLAAARSPPPSQRQPNFGAIYGGMSRPSSEGNSASHVSKPSLEQGLDDLKKALNMNFLRQA